MAKFYGMIGFAETTETSPGVWEEIIMTRPYFGDVIRETRQLRSGTDKVNDDININNRISIVADAYALSHFHTMRYVEWMSTKWKVSDIEVAHPRLILSVGGVYNE